MQERAKRLQRIVAVQQQMQRIEEWKLAELQRRLAALDASQRDLIEALNEDSVLHGLFVETTARHLNALAKESGRVDGEKAAQVPKLAEQTTRLRLAERLSATADLDAQRAMDRAMLLELIEAILKRGPTSLP